MCIRVSVLFNTFDYVFIQSINNSLYHMQCRALRTRGRREKETEEVLALMEREGRK